MADDASPFLLEVRSLASLREAAAACRGCHLCDGCQNVTECVRVQGYDLRAEPELIREGAHAGGGYGADFTDRLREDQVGLQLRERRCVDFIDTAELLHRSAHSAVHRSAVEPCRIETRAAEARAIEYFDRIVALVRNADDAVLEPERDENLRSTRQKRDDAPRLSADCHDQRATCGAGDTRSTCVSQPCASSTRP